jgi:hypothetical protein
MADYSWFIKGILVTTETNAGLLHAATDEDIILVLAHMIDNTTDGDTAVNTILGS